MNPVARALLTFQMLSFLQKCISHTLILFRLLLSPDPCFTKFTFNKQTLQHFVGFSVNGRGAKSSPDLCRGIMEFCWITRWGKLCIMMEWLASDIRAWVLNVFNFSGKVHPKKYAPAGDVCVCLVIVIQFLYIDSYYIFPQNIWGCLIWHWGGSQRVNMLKHLACSFIIQCWNAFILWIIRAWFVVGDNFEFLTCLRA